MTTFFLRMKNIRNKKKKNNNNENTEMCFITFEEGVESLKKRGGDYVPTNQPKKKKL